MAASVLAVIIPPPSIFPASVIFAGVADCIISSAFAPPKVIFPKPV